MDKNKRLNIIRGGVAKQIPGMPNYYFMRGLPHELGGIDIGKDLEVEGNEVVHVGKDNIKVYSSVPFLNGVSPAEKVLGGYNPATVFKEQEQFKKINGLKDDGTKKKLGGEDDISVLDKIKYNISKYIMATARTIGNNYALARRSLDKEGTPQNTFLLDKDTQKKYFLKNGYFEPTNKDYGLVRKAVGNRNIPIYQRFKDDIHRDNVIPIGNIMGKNHNNWFADLDQTLEHPGDYPTTIYVDSKTGDLYQKAWDLNDYGDKHGTTSNPINHGTNLRRLASNALDMLGNPTVVTTGIKKTTKYNNNIFNIPYTRWDNVNVPFIDENFKNSINKTLNDKGLYLNDIGDRFAYTLPEVVITGNKSNKKKLGGEDDDKIDLNYDPDVVGTSPDEIIKYYTNKGFGISPITNKLGFISKNGYNYNSEGRRDRYDKEFDEVNKIGYIGGSPTEARRKFYKSDKRFTQVVDSIADSHGLPRRVLKNSLANEGFIDTAIGDINTNYFKRKKGEAGYDNLIGDNLLNKHIYNIGFTRMGNDDSKTYYNTRKDVKRIIDNSPIKWNTVRNVNEKGRQVLTMDGSDNKANIVIHSALLTSFRNEIKKQHPNWTNDQIDNYTLYRFNYGPYAKGNINDVMKRDKFNAKNYEFRLGGKTKTKPKWKWVKSNVIGGKPRLVPYNEDVKYDAPKELMTYEHFGPDGGGTFSGGGAGGKIQYNPEPYKVETTDTLWVPIRETFNDAFAKARKQGLSKFNFNGKEYTTEIGNNPNNNMAGEKRYIETLIPIEHKKVQTKYNRFNRPKPNTYRAGGLYSLTVDGKNSLHQFPSTGESFARSAKGKVIARGGTKKRYTGEIKADDRSWIEKQYDNIKGYFTNERPDIAHAVRIASTLGLSELDNIEELVTGRKRYNNPNVQTGIAPIAGRKGSSSKNKRTLASIKGKRNNVKSNNSPNNYKANTETTPNVESPNTTVASNNSSNNATINNTKSKTNSFMNGAKQIGTMGRRQFKKGLRDMFDNDNEYGIDDRGVTSILTAVGFPILTGATVIGADVANRMNPIDSEQTNTDAQYYNRTNINNSIINDTIPTDTLIFRNDTIKPDTIKSDTVKYNKPSISSKVDSTVTPVKVNTNIKPNLSSSGTKVSTPISTLSTTATTPTNRPINTRPVNTRPTNNNGSTNNWIDSQFNIGVNNDNIIYDPIANIRGSKSTNYNTDNKIRGISEKPTFPTGKINPISLDNISPVELPETPVKQSKFKTFINNTFNKSNTKDIIGAGSNIVSSIIAHNMNKNMLNDLEYSPAPITRRANKLKTKININPQIDAMRESLANYRKHVNDNTASSRVARALMNRGLNSYTAGINQLYGNKENQETELINKDRLNQQEVTNANIADYNSWRNNKVAFNNAIREKKSENDVSLISNINAGIQDVISRGEKRFNERQNRLALMAANPNVNPLLLRDFGIEGITDEDIRNYYKVHGKKK